MTWEYRRGVFFLREEKTDKIIKLKDTLGVIKRCGIRNMVLNISVIKNKDLNVIKAQKKALIKNKGQMFLCNPSEKTKIKLSKSNILIPIIENELEVFKLINI